MRSGIRWTAMLAVVLGWSALSCGQEAWAGPAATRVVPQTLWVADGPSGAVNPVPFFSELNPNAIQQSGAPTVIMNAGNQYAFGSPTGIAFDSTPAAWVAFSGGAAIPYGGVLRFTQRNIRQLAHRHRTKVLAVFSAVPGTFDAPVNVAFDKSGNLWVANFGTRNLMEFTPDQLTKTGTPTPHMIIDISGLNQMGAMAFDNAGNLWITDGGMPPSSVSTPGAVDELTAEQLAAGGTQTPDLVLEVEKTSDNSFYAPYLPTGLAFDPSGNLWVTYLAGGEPSMSDGVVGEFPASDLAQSGTIVETPAVELTGTGSGIDRSISNPWGIAFDNLGNLWIGDVSVSPESFGHIVEFAPSDIATSGSPAPRIVLQSNVGTPGRQLYNFVQPTPLVWGPEIR